MERQFVAVPEASRYTILNNFSFGNVHLTVYIQGVIESCTDILTTSYWLHVELGKNI
jgi:hypothetical protein